MSFVRFVMPAAPPWTPVSATTRRAAVAALPALCVAALAITAGWAASRGEGLLAIEGALALCAALATVTRPHIAVSLWIIALLADGRQVTHYQVGPLYLTEILLGLLLFAGLAQLALRGVAGIGWWPVLAIFVTMWIPGLAGLLFQTDFAGLIWAQNFTMVTNSLFAAVAVFLLAKPGTDRRFLSAIIIGALLALIVVFTGNGGDGEPTSTGATRIAHGSYVLPFGIGALFVIALVAERVLPRRALVLLAPLLAGLILIEHRSGLIGIAVSLLLILGVRHTATPRLVLAAAAATFLILLVLFRAGDLPGRTLGPSLQRADSITNRTDPNIHYRLQFWTIVWREALKSPLIGQGFEPFPQSFQPRHTTAPEPNPQPHNSFVTLSYRIGVLPLMVLSCLLTYLVVAGFRVYRRHSDAHIRASAGALAATGVFLVIHCFFNVGLEVPYTATLFWLTFGALAAYVAVARADAA